MCRALEIICSAGACQSQDSNGQALASRQWISAGAAQKVQGKSAAAGEGGIRVADDRTFDRGRALLGVLGLGLSYQIAFVADSNFA